MLKLFVILIAYWVTCGIVGSRMGRDRGHPLLGTILGSVLGVVGLAVLLLIPPSGSRPQAA